MAESSRGAARRSKGTNAALPGLGSTSSKPPHPTSLQMTTDEARPARLPPGIAGGELVIAAVLLRGDFAGVPPAALAGRATLLDAAGIGLASFEIAFGPRQTISAAAGVVTSRSDVGWGGLELVEPSPGNAAFVPFDLRAAPRELSATGLLEVEPSKVTALDWGFDRYLAERTAIPVKLEWVTASGPLLDALRSVLPASDPP